MPIIQKKAQVPYSVSAMFGLVNDIEKYPEFVPWCVSSKVIARTEEEIRAELEFARGALRKSFATHNRLQTNKMVEIKLLHGPFRYLDGFWRFKEIENDGCIVMLDLDFEFSSKLLGLAFGPVFNQVASMLVDTFHKRADEVYGQ